MVLGAAVDPFGAEADESLLQFTAIYTLKWHCMTICAICNFAIHYGNYRIITIVNKLFYKNLCSGFVTVNKY